MTTGMKLLRNSVEMCKIQEQIMAIQISVLRDNHLPHLNDRDKIENLKKEWERLAGEVVGTITGKSFDACYENYFKKIL